MSADSEVVIVESSGSPDPTFLAPVADPLLGRTLNERFRVLEAIGQGGMGKVYKAIQSPLDRVVALKILNPNFPAEKDPAFRRRFLLEASMTSKLRHPNTVTVIDYGQTDDGIFYIAMELLEGRTLAEVLAREKTLPWQRVLDVGQQISRSLREAHNLGVVHRDLKPANVMLLHDAGHDVVKVLDFGLVKSFQLDPTQIDPEVTQNGMFLGSPQYMAPEQARNLADPRSDVYSLGVLLYQMLVGRPPFLGKDYLDVIFMHMKEVPRGLRLARPDLDIPDDVEALVLKCLEKDPARRYASMDELLDALRYAAMVNGMSGSGIFSALRPSPVPAATPPPYLQSGSPSGLDPGDAANTLAFDISVEPGSSGKLAAASAQTQLEVPAMFASLQREQRKAPWVPLGVIGALVLGFGGVWLLAMSGARSPAAPSRASPPTAQGKGPAPAAPTAPGNLEDAAAARTEPHKVRFHVTSEPAGARILIGRREVGVTPALFELPARADGTAQAELVFMLEGYPAQSATAGGSGDVMLMQRLQKRVYLHAPSPVVAEGAPGSAPSETASSPPAETRSSPPPGGFLRELPAPKPALVAAVAAARPLLSEPPLVLRASVPVSGTGGGTPPVLSYQEGMSRPEPLSEGRTIQYSREAIAARVGGVMVVRCTITTQGTIENCRTVKPVPFMEEAVLESLKTRRYRPILYGGKAVAVDYVFTVRLVPPKR